MRLNAKLKRWKADSNFISQSAPLARSWNQLKTFKTPDFRIGLLVRSCGDLLVLACYEHVEIVSRYQVKPSAPTAIRYPPP